MVMVNKHMDLYTKIIKKGLSTSATCLIAFSSAYIIA